MSVIVDGLPANTNKSSIDPFVDGQSAISECLGGYMHVHIRYVAHNCQSHFALRWLYIYVYVYAYDIYIYV